MSTSSDLPADFHQEVISESTQLRGALLAQHARADRAESVARSLEQKPIPFRLHAVRDGEIEVAVEWRDPARAETYWVRVCSVDPRNSSLDRVIDAYEIETSIRDYSLSRSDAKD